MSQDEELAALLIHFSSDPFYYETIVQFWKHMIESKNPKFRFITQANTQPEVEATVDRWTTSSVECRICKKRCQKAPLLEELVISQIETKKTDRLELDVQRWKNKAWEISKSTDCKAMDDLTAAMDVLTEVHRLVQPVDAYQWPPRG